MLRGAVERILPSTIAWLAPEDDLHAELAGAGLDADAATLRARLEASLGPGLSAIGVALPAAETDGWDEARGRGAGQPDDDAVERARGIRNRALFVE